MRDPVTGQYAPPLPTFNFGHRKLCTYCGDPPVGHDHVIPISAHRPNNKIRARGGPWTWACLHCNSKLNNLYFSDFRYRCEYIQQAVDKRAKAIFWSESELAKLDYNLAQMIKTKRNWLLWQRARADWFGSRDFYFNLESLLWQEHLDRASNKFNKPIYEYFWNTVRDVKIFLYER